MPWDSLRRGAGVSEGGGAACGRCSLTAQCLHLVVSEYPDNTDELRDTVHEVGELITFIRDSPKRLAQLVSMGSQISLHSLFPSRWTCSEASLDSILKNYSPL